MVELCKIEEEKLNELRDAFINSLNNEINRDFVLVGVPKHMNIGDTLIWEAENELLSNVKYRKKHTYYSYDNIDKMEISPTDIIVFSGGGTLNDIWSFIPWCINVLKRYNKNKIVFLPNSIFFNDKKKECNFIKILKEHLGDIFIYCRELQSYNFCSKKIPFVKCELQPDVVICWDIKKYMLSKNIDKKDGNGTLYIHRLDKEKTSETVEHFDKKTDWPTMSNTPQYAKKNISAELWEREVKDKLINDAISFVDSYESVISDRMHGALLAWLLGKKTFLINNSYGKSISLYNTWFK